MKILFTILISASLFGCSDIVTSRYKTRSDAEADRLFARGWLPYLIPQSSKNIVTSNDLDVNTSEGEFTFDADDLDEFISKLSKVDDPSFPRNSMQLKLIKANYIPYEFSEDDSRWIFFIHSESGHCEYWMYYNKKNKTGRTSSLTLLGQRPF